MGPARCLKLSMPIKHLTNHPIADYRLRVGNYRVLFDVDWSKKEIHVLKIGHRRDVY